MKKKVNKVASKGKSRTKQSNKSPCAKEIPTSLKKQYVKSKSICKVTFRLPKDAAPSAKSVTIVGDFNKWNVTQTPMKRLKNGDFTLTLELPCDREYNFRYLIDANRWEKDWFADKHIPGDTEVDDSVVVV
jgi:1,4-alpha-glucan branching enzyme